MALGLPSNNGTCILNIHGRLNDFLPKLRKGSITYTFSNSVSVKDAIEAIGIPHVEIGCLTQHNESISFSYLIKDGDCIEVYPQTSATINADDTSLRPSLNRPLRFILDVHLGSLARLLRLTGFDTLYDTQADDATIARIASVTDRIVLTRDIGLLKHKIINWVYWLRSQHTDEQFLEVANLYDLWSSLAPFTLCIGCNGTIMPIKKEDVVALIPANTALYFDTFYRCSSCQQVYWKGPHYGKMLKKLEQLKSSKLG